MKIWKSDVMMFFKEGQLLYKLYGIVLKMRSIDIELEA